MATVVRSEYKQNIEMVLVLENNERSALANLLSHLDQLGAMSRGEETNGVVAIPPNYLEDLYCLRQEAFGY